MWGELASHKRLFNPQSQFSRLGTQGPAPMLCCVVSCVFVNVFCVSFLCVSEVEVLLPFCSFLYLSMAGMLYTIIPCCCPVYERLKVCNALHENMAAVTTKKYRTSEVKCLAERGS